MRLYKYVSGLGSLPSIAAGSLKFTPITQLNDPMEVLPFFDAVEVRKSLDTIRSQGCSEEQRQWLERQERVLQELAPKCQRIPAPATVEKANAIFHWSFYDNLPLMASRLKEAVELIRSRVGVLSLTARWDCVPMWAHYADNAKGFVIAYDYLDTLFADDPSGCLNVAMKVRYRDYFSGMTFDPSSLPNLFFSKLEDWGYEAEWRIVRPLASCELDQAGNPLHWIPRENVTAVICGWNVADGQFVEVRDLVGKANPNAIVARSTVELGQIKLDRELQTLGAVQIVEDDVQC